MSEVRQNILIIDDSMTVCTFVSKLLSKHDYQTTVTHDMETALESFEMIRPDMVLTDIMMPGIGGLAGISLLRGKWPDIGIVAMSAGTDSIDSKDTLSAARRMGADAVIKKPFNPGDLYKIVEATLQSYGPGSKRKRVLIVDDSSTIRMLLSRELSDCGYICQTADSMEEMLKSENIVGLDLVIVDIFMPGIGGIAGIAHIRENWPDIKIVAISGGFSNSEGDDALTAAKKTGADATLQKPFDMAALGTTIDKLLL
ncbi:MAG: response regulator [Alphaproteobacteria bacterium]